MPWNILRILLIILAGGLIICVIWIGYTSIWQDPESFFDGRRSRQINVQNLSVERHQGLIIRSIVIRGSESPNHPEHAVEFKAYYCSPESLDEQLPAFVLMGGLVTGRDAIYEITSRPEISRLGAFITLDYPWVGPDRFKGLEILPWIPRLRQALFDGVEAMRLAVDYLETRSEIDRNRIVLFGVSLGSFYAINAGGVDSRPAAVLAFQGGGYLRRLISANMRRTNVVPGLLTGPLGWFAAMLLQPLEPKRLVGKIAPRPFIQVNAADDEMVPVSCANALHDAAREPRTMVWIDTPHVRPGLDYIIQEIINIADTQLRKYRIL